MVQPTPKAEDETAQVDASGRATGRDIEELVSSVKQLTEQVQNQAYSKKDIERLGERVCVGGLLSGFWGVAFNMGCRK